VRRGGRQVASEVNLKPEAAVSTPQRGRLIDERKAGIAARLRVTFADAAAEYRGVF
jgi:hypothetical protein